MLTYEHEEIYKVKQDGKIIGEIRSEGFQYRYWPKGVTKVERAGDAMLTPQAVMRSLEG